MARNNCHENSHEWARLMKTVDQVFPGIDSRCHNFTVVVEGQPSFIEGDVLIRAEIQEARAGFRALPPSNESWTSRRCIVRLRRVEWDILRHCGSTWKIIQASVRSAWRDYVLDCTGVYSVVVARATLTQGTVIHVAELFSGGFAGWAQAAYVLRKAGIPLESSWSIDRDPACHRMTVAADPGRQVATNWREVDDVRFTQDTGHWHIQGDVEDDWWLVVAQTRPVQVITVSAPCQPWSRAGSGAGLASSDGAAMLRAADVCGFLETPLVALEQVEGFVHHHDGQKVLDGWRQAGYRIIWRETLDLAQVLPVSRKRHLLLLAHESFACDKTRPSPWVPFTLPDLGRAGVLLDLSQDILRQCLLHDEQAEVHGPVVPPPKVERDAKGSSSRVGCFVAQYGSQHLLPESALSTKGLHGHLLQHKGVIRFFSPRFGL